MALLFAENFAPQPGAATATIPAQGAGRRIVCTLVRVQLQRVAGSTAMSAVLRDGLTGVGPILRTYPLAGSTSLPDTIIIYPYIIGSANTAMTLEFVAGSVNYNTFVSVAGYAI